MTPEIDSIHQFWFGELDAAGFSAPLQARLWFSASAKTDANMRNRFGDLVVRALDGELDQWQADDSGLVALLLLLDQFTRNIYRGTPSAFAGDEKALALATQAIEAKRDHALPAVHRVFLYLPLEHSESLEMQEWSVDLFNALHRDTKAASIGDFARYAAAHRDVIARFGRFPHRNPILGRESSARELAYLKRHGGF